MVPDRAARFRVAVGLAAVTLMLLPATAVLMGHPQAFAPTRSLPRGTAGVPSIASPPARTTVPSAYGPSFVADTLEPWNNTLSPGNPSLPQDYRPQSLVYDSGRGEVFVSSAGSGDPILVYNDSTSVVRAIGGMGLSPALMAYDSGKGEIFVAGANSHLLYVMSDSNNTVTSSTPLYAVPTGLAYDSAKGEVFVSTSGGIDVVSDSTNQIIASVGVSGDTSDIAYDSQMGEVFASSSTSNTVSVISDSNNSVVATIGLSGQSPEGVAYDPTLGEVFVALQNPTSVDVISDFQDSVVASIPLVGYPYQLTYDPATRQVFVATTDNGAGVVGVISDISDREVANVTVGDGAQGIALDSGKGTVVVANGNAGSLSVISDALDRVVANIPTATDPQGVVYDPARHEIFVASELTSMVYVISTDTNRVVATVWACPNPFDLAYDSGRGEVFVTCEGAYPNYNGTVGVISDVNNTVVASINVLPDPQGIAYDPLNGEVYVAIPAGGSSPSLQVISDSSNTVVKGVDAGPHSEGVVFDSSKDEIFVSQGAEGWQGVAVLSGSNDTVIAHVNTSSGSWGESYDFGQGTILVANSLVNSVSVIADSSNSVTTTIGPVGWLPWDTIYDSGNGEVFVSEYDSANVTVLSALAFHKISVLDVGATPRYGVYDPDNHLIYLTEDGAVAIISDGFGGTTPYNATFTAQGLPTGSSWSVRLNGTTLTSSGSSVTFAETDNSYPFAVTGPAVYSVSPSVGTVTILGSSVSVQVAFTPVVYTVGFVEVGLPAGVTWSISLGGVFGYGITPSPISFSETYGNYGFIVGTVPGFVATPASGSVAADSSPLETAITFVNATPAMFPVTFSESGLRSGTGWSVTLAGVINASTSPEVSFLEPDGTYAYAVNSVPGYAGAPSTGTVNVSGGAITSTILFVALPSPLYTVLFSETGLPQGTNWSISMAGVVAHSTTNVISFDEANGTYSYAIGRTAGYSGTPSAGTLVVRGPAVSPVVIHFTKPAAKPSTLLGLPGSTAYAVLGGVAIAALVVLLLIRKRRGLSRPGAAEGSGERPRSSSPEEDAPDSASPRAEEPSAPAPPTEPADME